MSARLFPWIFSQTYEHLLLVHWPVPADRLRAVVPAGLALGAFDGASWIGHDVYVGTRSHLRGLPPVPGFDARPVVTLRTIVEMNGVPGIYLISLDAPGAITAWLERRFLHIHSRAAQVDILAREPSITVRAQRTDDPCTQLRAAYHPTGPARTPRKGSLAWFLLGGSCVYTADPRGRLHVIEVEHDVWDLAEAEVAIETDTIAGAAFLPGPNTPLVAMYQRSQRAHAAAPRSL